MNRIRGKAEFWRAAATPKDDSVAVILAGGGSYGAYEVGVMKALFQGRAPVCDGKPLDAQVFLGTSVGSVNAAVMVAYAETGLAKAVATLEKIWLEEIAETVGKCSNGIYHLRGVPLVTNPACFQNPLGLLTDALDDGVKFLRESFLGGKRFLDSNQSLTQRALEILSFSVFFDTTPLRTLLTKWIPLEAIGRSTKILKIIATNFDSGQVQIFDNRDLATTVGYEAILASAAIPIFFAPVKIGDDIFVDGVTLANSPVLPALGLANNLHVIYMDPDVSNIPIKTLDTTIGILDRLLVTKWAFTMNQEIQIVADFNASYNFLDNRRTLPPNADPRFAQLLEAADAVSTDLAQESLVQTTIHRYHPRDDLGDITGFLDLGAGRIKALLERGYQDAIAHDCRASGCILPR